MPRKVFTPVRLAAVVAAAGLAGTASAQAPPCGPSCGPAKSLFGKKCPEQKMYPVFDSHYIKKFCGPTVNPGTCFGFYHTQWRPWHEACNEPVPPNPGPTVYPAPPAPTEPATEPEAEKKDGEKKEPAAPAQPKEPAPQPAPAKDAAKPEKEKSAAAPAVLPPALPVSRPKTSEVPILVPPIPQVQVTAPVIEVPAPRK
jgi:hypothetical protein